MARGQAKRRGIVGRLLAWLSTVLTVLTALALLALLAGGPSPADRDTRPDLGTGAADGMPGARARLDLSWLADLGQLARSGGLRLSDTTIHLLNTPAGAPIELVLDPLTIASLPGGKRVRLAGHLMAASPIPVTGTAQLDATGLDASLEVAQTGGLAGLVGLDGVTIAGGPLRLDLEATTDGERLRARLTNDGPMLLGATADSGVLPVDRLEVVLRRDGIDDALQLERLELTSPALRLDATGSLAPESVRVDARLTDVDMRWAGHLWPRSVAVNAREWVVPNIPEGRVDELIVAVSLDADALAGRSLDASAIQGTARVSGAEIHYLRPMPPATEAAATARFDANRLTFEVTGGRLQAVEVLSGTVTIADYGTDGVVETLATSIEARGPVANILEVVDYEPLRLATRHDLPKGSARGAGDFRIEVDLPLLRELDLDDVGLRFLGTFTEVTLPGMAAGRDLSDASVRLDATPDRVTAEGDGRIADLPLAFSYDLDTTQDTETLAASGRVDASGLVALGLPAGLPIAGPVTVSARVNLAGAAERTDLDLDLVDAEVELPLFSVWKPAGIEARAAASILEYDDRTELERLTLDWPGVNVAASASLDANDALLELDVAPLVIAATDLAVAAVRQGSALHVDVTGKHLDVGALRIPRSEGQPAAANAMPDMALSWAIDAVSNGGEVGLLDVTGGASISADWLREANLSARTETTSRGLEINVDPTTGDGLTLAMVSEDAGGAMRALGLSDALMGGTLHVDALATPAPGGLRAAGRLMAEDVVIAGAPLIVRQLADVPEIEGLSTDALELSAFTAPFSVDGSVLTITDAAVLAGELAVRFWGDIDLETDDLDLAGNLAPWATINRFIGRLPVIGNLLQGTREAGAFAVSFTIKGPRTAPEVVVNPWTFITPGLLQDLFGGTGWGEPRVPED